MFCDNSNESLKTTKNSAVDHNWSRRRLIRSVIVVICVSVLQIESIWKLEVELDSRTLEGALECVRDGDIDFGSVEGTIAGVELPFSRREFF